MVCDDEHVVAEIISKGLNVQGAAFNGRKVNI